MSEVQPVDPRIPLVGIVRSYRRKGEIVCENGPANRIYEVVSGTVCTYRMLREGRRQVVGFYFAGDFFGLESAENRSLAAEAITDASVRIVNKQALSALALSDVEVGPSAAVAVNS
jgi:CRP/FNR family transcriptional regulator, nitrogen fixation regulation protein